MTVEGYIEEFLKKRGYATREEMRALFEYDEASLRKAGSMCGGSELLESLSEAVDAQKNVVIYGDYDADGIMAAFILYSGLEKLIPGRVKIFINNRFEDGYNITPASIKKLVEMYPQTEVIITCDNGIGASEAFESIDGNGITVLVSDHHEQGNTLPDHIPAVDEKSKKQKETDLKNSVKRDDFCGAELARKIVHELFEMRGLEKEEKDFLDGLYAYSGFATITDSVPMNPANHYVAKRGLEVIRADKGFFEILKNETGNDRRRIDAYTIGFHYGPLFNAAGRVTGTAKNALAAPVLYAMGYEAECAKVVRGLTVMNEQRKEMCRKEDSAAFSMIEENGWDKDPFILVAGEEFSEGINGLTAAHIVNKYGVPAAVLSPVRNEKGIYKGSARSREGFDLFRAFSSHPDRIKAGGHPMAAGLAVKEEDIDAVREILKKDAFGIRYKDAEADFVFTPKDISVTEVENMQKAFASLEPFGPELEPPVVSIRGSVYPVRALKDVHAKFTMRELSSDGYYIDLVWWNHLAEAEKLSRAGSEILFTGEPKINEWNGKISVQFNIYDARPV